MTDWQALTPLGIVLASGLKNYISIKSFPNLSIVLQFQVAKYTYRDGLKEMNFAIGTRFCSKAGVCYKVIETIENVISLVNVKNSTVVAYKVEDLKLFLPAFEHDELLD
ncbi:hypothetical protein H6F86_02000 [Phormidium sp. FACHB-592]|uniref:Uncharacterized protein n=1 Tax=Stenomitos frigidus AS-A4 TaxID=2933935 RepID=A0ABV0KJQ7_9CYAN|nr:hypothetical protein [Phormidium sp. FACHB-592]MBD2072679.1 hypothetical protein [Phormidium sp. FACHB-592]